MSDMDREFVRCEKEAKRKRGEADPVSVIYNPLGWTAGQCVGNWSDQVLEAIIRKLDKIAAFRWTTHHDLLICNDADVPLFLGRERKQAFDAVALELKKLESRYAQSFRSVSVVMSREVEYDIGGKRRLLAYHECEGSDRGEETGVK